jgi:phosphatidylserine/phosphatidylglycerophosphate/cardiolipin synthase-like enzyme
MEIKRSLINRIRNAERRVWIATAYFLPSWKIRRLLRHAAQRGIDVRLLLPGPHSDHPSVSHAGRRFYARLLHHGVRIFEYQPCFLHAKMLLCDEWLSVGSSNIDRWNLRWNLEANQELLDGELVEQAVELFERDYGNSEEITDTMWQARPWYRRLQEWFWGRVDRWLERRTRPSRRDKG